MPLSNARQSNLLKKRDLYKSTLQKVEKELDTSTKDCSTKHLPPFDPGYEPNHEFSLKLYDKVKDFINKAHPLTFNP